MAFREYNDLSKPYLTLPLGASALTKPSVCSLFLNKPPQSHLRGLLPSACQSAPTQSRSVVTVARSRHGGVWVYALWRWSWESCRLESHRPRASQHPEGLARGQARGGGPSEASGDECSLQTAWTSQRQQLKVWRENSRR